MKNIYNFNMILILTFLLSNMLCLSQVWERINGPYDNIPVKLLVEYENNLYAKSISSYGDKVYKLESDTWIQADNLLNHSRLIDVESNEFVKVIARNDSISISYDNGASWKRFHDPYLFSGRENTGSIFLIDNEIITVGIYDGYLRRYDKKSSEWDFVLSNYTDGDTLLADNYSLNDSVVFISNRKKFNMYKQQNIEYGSKISTDYGRTWNELENFDEYIVSSVFYNNRLIVCTIDSTLYESKDLGKTWEKLSDTHLKSVKFVTDNNYIFSQLYDGNIVLSKDGGNTWIQKNLPIVYHRIEDIYYLNNSFYTVTDNSGRIFKYDFEKDDWVLDDRLITKDLTSRIMTKDNDTLYLSTGGRSGLQYSTDYGTSWNILSGKLAEYELRYSEIKKKDNIIVAEFDYSTYLLVSSDNGVTWDITNVGLGYNSPFITGIKIINEKIFVSTKFGLRVSEDFGQTWQEVEDEVLKYDVGCFIPFEGTDSELYVISDNKLLKSTDSGNNWEVITSGGLLEDLGGTVSKKIDGDYYIATNGSLYRYNLETDSWDELLDYSKVKPFISDFLYYNNHFIIPVDRGVVITDDFGITFEEYLINNDSSENKFRDLIIVDGKLISTSRNGLWQAKLKDLGIIETSVDVEVKNYLYTLEPYPQPAKNQVKLEFYWDINLPMELKDISIFDINGNLINKEDNLTLEKLGQHHGNLIWDCSNIESGIYIVKINHGTEVKTSKVIITR